MKDRLRILFTFAGGIGHFMPLVGLARAALAAGHDVAFGAQPAMIAVVAQAGFAVFETAGVSFGDDKTRLPLLAHDMEREYRAVRDGYAGRIARARAGAIVALARAWQPQIVVCDEMDFGAMIAAEMLRVPHASVLVIATGALTPHGLIGPNLQALRSEFGLAADPKLEMLSRHLVLCPFPPQLRTAGHLLPATARFFRTVTPSPRRACARTIHVTLGTVFNVESGDLFARVLTALHGHAGKVEVAVGTQIDPADFGPQPDHIKVKRFVDQSIVLPRCRLVICHGGSGTMLAALAHGVPMVLLPMGADQSLNAHRCAELGVARVLDAVLATPAQIAACVDEVLGGPAYHHAADRMSEAISAMPCLASALRHLEALVPRRASGG